jgi:hypothetical protein
MVPLPVSSTAPEVYSKSSPGRSQGCSPTTPSPRTSTTLPLSSVISQWRLIRRAGTLPRLWMRMV